ncbi:GNAT family N-acetyltransferase [bacterium]|nr:GNAT family N-acetyltransferase [bacterium]
MYNARILTANNYEKFESLYEDFRNRAVTEYNFELEPLDFKGFLEAIDKDLIKCIVLFDENEKPEGFLVYTTAISEAIELNIIHCRDKNNLQEGAQELLAKFLDVTQNLRREKIVCYPMLGEQKSLISVIAKLGFKFVGIEVLRFMTQGTSSREIFSRARVVKLPEDYELTRWSDQYFEDAVSVIQESFNDSSDALFDPRFKSMAGTRDIITKIVKDVYAKFLPKATSVLLYEGKPVGFSFMNITGGSIVNIPLVGIKQEHQGKGLSTIMLKHSMDVIFKEIDTYNVPITEINTTTETNNLQALRLYKNLGFLEDYNYPQSYLPLAN